MTEFRLDSLRVENFRSISGGWTIPLDAQVILVHGPNGAGKTSLLSAIELAATGSVSFLQEEFNGLHDILLNRNYPLGNVQLRLRSAEGDIRSGSISLDSRGLDGVGALDEDESNYFLERCFLPQTALGRLLETYTATGRQVDTALVRFVKTVVGLDDLDSLIDGLRPAGHLARARAASPRWDEAEADRSSKVKSKSQLQTKLAQGERDMAQAAGALRTLLGIDSQDIADADLPRHVAPTPDSELVDRGHLESLRVRLEGLEAAYANDLTARGASADSAAQAEAANRAAWVYDQWQNGDGERALRTLNEIRDREFSLANLSLAQMFDGYDDAQSRLQELITRRSAVRQRRLQAEESRSQLTADLVAVTVDLESLEEEAKAIDVPRDVRVLLDIIEKTIPRVVGNICPICDQEFREAGNTLREHLAEKATSLSDGAQRLMEVNERLNALRASAAVIRGQLESLTVPAEEDAAPDALARELNALDKPINVGRALSKEVDRMESRRAEATSYQASQDVARRNLSSIRDELGLQDLGLSVPEEIEWLYGVIEQRSQASLYEVNRQRRETLALRDLEDRQKLVADLRAELTAVQEEHDLLQEILREAEARKRAANELRLNAERIRSSVINHVFDRTLNTLWADLFSRFVPSEPFVPRFRKQSEAKRSVDIHLETVLPSGEVSGAPSSMLSYGNTNTAALSLFIALHLSAPTELPWLIFDDPVQSMDDIHIANFATVVRQLSYAHNRQVVIAVHQEELFEYLALELAPATPKESLLKVSLDRRGDTSFISTERVEHHPEPSLTLDEAGMARRQQ